MMTFVENLKAAAAKRAKYNRTVAELRALDDHAVLDLNIARADIPEIARKAVYGA